MPQPFLIVLHQETSTPGRIGYALRQRGYALDVRRRHHLRRPHERERHRRFHPSRDRLAARPAQGAETIPRHLPRCADARAPSRQPRLSPSRRPRRGRLLPDPADRDRPHGVRSLAGAGLPVASRGLRPAGRRRLAGGGRFLPGAGVSLRRRRLRAAISSRRDPRHDVPVDHARA